MHLDQKISVRIAVVGKTHGNAGAGETSKYGALDQAGLPASLTPFAEKLLELHDQAALSQEIPLKSLKQKPSATASLNYLLELRQRSQEILKNRKKKRLIAKASLKDLKISMAESANIPQDAKAFPTVNPVKREAK